MTKVELTALVERWQAKADRAMERYQEDGLPRHNREREQAQDLAQIDEAASIWLSGWDAATMMLTGGDNHEN